MTPTPLDCVERNVPDDLQQPRPRILATESFERSEGPHERVLHHVLGDGGILHQPARDAVRRPEMWNDVPLEGRARLAFTARKGATRWNGLGTLAPSRIRSFNDRADPIRSLRPPQDPDRPCGLADQSSPISQIDNLFSRDLPARCIPQAGVFALIGPLAFQHFGDWRQVRFIPGRGRRSCTPCPRKFFRARITRLDLQSTPRRTDRHDCKPGFSR